MMRQRVDCRFRKLEIKLKDDQNTRAEALFKKEERMREGAKATAEYKATQEALREKTPRLRALRLARDTAKQTGVTNSETQPG
jgi:hypothetical protein